MAHFEDLQWSFSSLGCPELDLPGIVALAKRHGLEKLELRTVEDRVDLPDLFRERYGEPAELARYLEGEKVKVVSLDASLKLVGNGPEDRESLVAFAEWADGLGTPYIRIFDGGSFAPELAEADLKECLETINWWRAEKGRNGWSTDIMVETHDCLTASGAIRELQASLEEPVPILWDTHHTWKKAGEATADTWSVVQPYVPHIHLKDSISKPSARHPFTYVHLGDGEFDLRGTLQLLQDSGYEGIVSIEWERKWHPYLDPMEEALQRSRALGLW